MISIYQHVVFFKWNKNIITGEVMNPLITNYGSVPQWWEDMVIIPRYFEKERGIYWMFKKYLSSGYMSKLLFVNNTKKCCGCDVPLRTIFKFSTGVLWLLDGVHSTHGTSSYLSDRASHKFNGQWCSSVYQRNVRWKEARQAHRVNNSSERLDEGSAITAPQ